jgi:hypothetical protein
MKPEGVELSLMTAGLASSEEASEPLERLNIGIVLWKIIMDFPPKSSDI